MPQKYGAGHVPCGWLAAYREGGLEDDQDGSHCLVTSRTSPKGTVLCLKRFLFWPLLETALGLGDGTTLRKENMNPRKVTQG